jgi:tRNA(fMet)-specific endonuclease VapC
MVDNYQGLLDTSIIIDILRGYQPAVDWLSQQSNLGVTRIVWLEILEGAQNKQSQQKGIALLKGFGLMILTEADVECAVEKMLVYSLSHNIDALDCLIASVHFRVKIPLYTRNLKHFKPLLGTLAMSPYSGG